MEDHSSLQTGGERHFNDSESIPLWDRSHVHVRKPLGRSRLKRVVTVVIEALFQQVQWPHLTFMHLDRRKRRR